MKIHTERHPSVAAAPSAEQLAPISVKLLSIRAAFLDHLDILPAPFSAPIKQHYLDRLVRAEERHMLGEYAPFLLADVLRIPEESALRIAIPWLVLYEHALLVDDIVDVKAKAWTQEILLSQILYDDFISLWKEQFFANPDLWHAFRAYHTEGVAAALKELEQDSKTTINSSTGDGDYEYHLTMGRKAALVKFCGTALSAEHKGRLLSPIEEEGIDKLCAGIQLLDDLSDCAEDYKERRDTFPLRAAFDGLGRLHDLSYANRRALSEDELTYVLIISGTTTRIARLVRYYLTSGLEALHVPEDSATGRYLLSLIGSTSRATSAIEELLNENSRLIEIMSQAFREDEKTWEQLLAEPLYVDIWAEMKSHFNSIPRASN